MTRIGLLASVHRMFSYHFPGCPQFPPQASVRIARVAAIGETEDERPNGTIRVHPVDGHLLDEAIYGNQAVEFMQGLKVCGNLTGENLPSVNSPAKKSKNTTSFRLDQFRHFPLG